MNIFWPEGLSVSDVRSPYEILESAREEWETASDGVLTLVFQESEPNDGIETITVHAKHIPSNRTVTLFSVIHRLNEPYPVAIQPREEKNLSNILKKTYRQPRFGSMVAIAKVASVSEDKKDRARRNEWISDTPSEFRNKLTEAFNLSVVKSAVVNLTTSKGASMENENAAQE
ncbi:MAG: hypothetical protein Q3M30_03420 [Candidatus Electrothrix sp. Rat3]|nr:hypothetical protein [Candidatus Electrothrix rattekaaiensis]